MDTALEPSRPAGSLEIATEPVRGSDIPVRLICVETIDGLYTPIGLRVPPGDGPFPLVLFASGNGGGGIEMVRDFTQNRSWTQEEFLSAGYAVAWTRYRAEVDYVYDRIGKLIEDRRQGRQLLNRGPLEYEDVVSIAEAVKRLPFIAADRIGYMGMSHGGEMALKIASEYHGFRAMVASEPAAHEFLRLRPDATAGINPETGLLNVERMLMREPAKVRARITEDVARERGSARSARRSLSRGATRTSCRASSASATTSWRSSGRTRSGRAMTTSGTASSTWSGTRGRIRAGRGPEAGCEGYDRVLRRAYARDAGVAGDEIAQSPGLASSPPLPDRPTGILRPRQRGMACGDLAQLRQHRRLGRARPLRLRVDMQQHLLGGRERVAGRRMDHRLEHVQPLLVDREHLRRRVDRLQRPHLLQMHDVRLDGEIAAAAVVIGLVDAGEGQERVRAVRKDLQIARLGHVAVIVDPFRRDARLEEF